ncbi:MAG: glycosyltransferase family 2 protein [Burkholderiales bacterium]
MQSSKKAPAISIVTLSYNQGKFLEECITSVLGQDCEGAEYIVVDPGSADDSRDIIGRHASGIAKVLLDPDDGPADGLNKGFGCATAGLFGYLNADDRLCPGALNFVVQYFAAHPRVDVLCGSIRIIGENGKASLRRRTADAFDVRRYVAGICTVGQQATFFRRKAFYRAGGFNTANRIAWDGELLVDLALSQARFATTRRVLGDFRIYNDSITGSASYRQRLDAYQRRLEEKLRARRIDLYSPAQTALLRVAYKADPIRHIGYFLAR